jgi:predicted histone-like DNA-binding protein
MLETIVGELSEGRTVEPGKLGSFSISLSSEGADTPETLTAASIKKSRIIYRPGTEIKKIPRNLTYEKHTA